MPIVLLALLILPIVQTGPPQNFLIDPNGHLVADPAGAPGSTTVGRPVQGHVAVLSATTTVMVVRNATPGARTVLLPLYSTDLKAVLRQEGAGLNLPDGALFVSCAYGSGLCASWLLQPAQSIPLPVQALRANVGDRPIIASLVVRDPDGKGTVTPISFEANIGLTLRASGFAPPAPPASSFKLSGDKVTSGRQMTALKVENSHTQPYELYVELEDVPSPTSPVTRLLEAAALRVRDCPMRAGVICAVITVPPASTTGAGVAYIPLLLLPTSGPRPHLNLIVRTADGGVPAVATTAVEVDGLSSQSPSGRLDAMRDVRPGVRGLLVPLDNTGIADWDFVNPRHPPVVVGEDAEIAFENRTGDRAFVVAVPVNRDAAVTPQPIEPCRHISELQCVFLTVSPGTTKSVRRAAVADPARPIVRFSVTFFNETASPTRGTGYFRTSTAAFESPSRFPWGLTAQINGIKQPEFVRDANNDEVRITDETPYEGRMTSSLAGLARLSLKPNLGDRADADVDVLLHQRNLGGTDTRVASGLRTDLDPVSVPKYVLTVYALRGLQFSFGKAPFLDTQLLSEAGEGFRLNYRNYGLMRLTKRESADRVPNRDNDDHEVWIGQANHLTIKRSQSLRSVSLAGIYGRDLKPETKRTYWSASLEAFFTVPVISVQGVASVVHNRRSPQTPSASNREGEGTVGLFTATWSKMSPGSNPQVQRSIQLTLAQASSDNLSTPTIDEGFIGESAKFAPDILFLGSFASRLGPKPDPLPLIPPGLSNKSYFSLGYTEEKFSLLEWVASIVGIPPEDVISRRTIVRYHRYRFRETVLGVRHPGDEISLEFLIETPRGIRTQLGYSRFLSAPAFHGLFRKEPWRLAAGITVVM